jgi:hypothetical protein
MTRFEEFIRKDTERQGHSGDPSFQKTCQALDPMFLRLWAVKSNLQEAAIQNPGLAREARHFLAAARLRRYVLVKNLGGTQNPVLPAVPANPGSDLTQLEATIRKYAGELQKAAMADERKKLETELAELSDRELASFSAE